MHCYLTRTKAATPATKETKQFTSVASQTSIYMYNIKTVRMYKSYTYSGTKTYIYVYNTKKRIRQTSSSICRETITKENATSCKNRHVRIENQNQASKPAETVELLFSNRGAFVETPRPRTVGLGSKYEWM